MRMVNDHPYGNAHLLNFHIILTYALPREVSPRWGGARRAEGCRLRLSNKPLPYKSFEMLIM